MGRRPLLLLALLAALVLMLLGAALVRWQEMTRDLERMNRRLQEAAVAQQELQRRLEETRRLLEQQMSRLRRMETRQAGGEPPPTKEAQP